MARTRIDLVLSELNQSLTRAQRLTLSVVRSSRQQRGRYSQAQRDMVIEVAFLRSFASWESFLEQVFTLYMLGKGTPSNYKPTRYVFPVDRKHAENFARAEQRHTDWTAAERVIARSERCFRDGEPFASAIRPHIRSVNDMKTLRNAIAHQSHEASLSFEGLVRRELGYLPVGIGVARFLMTIHSSPGSHITYFDHYQAIVRGMAIGITP